MTVGVEMVPPFERGPSRGPELNPNELTSLQAGLIAVLKHRGQPHQYRGQYPVSAGDKMPQSRIMKVSPIVQKEIFYPDDPLMSAASPGHVSYNEPHLINPRHVEPGGPVYEQIVISLDWRIGHGSLEQQDSYYIELTDGVINGSASTHILENGRAVNPSNLKRARHESDDELLEFLRDLDASSRPLDQNDAKKIRLLTNVLR